MSKMLKFAWMDLLAIKPYFVRTTLIMAIAALGIGFMQQSPETTVVVLGAYTMFFVLIPFSVGEKSGLDRFYSTLAISRDTVVTGRYAFLFLCQVAAVLLSVLAGLFLKGVLHTQTNLNDLAASAIGIQLVLAVFLAIMIPIFFKMGYTKARLFSFIPFVGIMALTPFLNKLANDKALKEVLDRAAAFVQSNTLLTLVIVVLISLLLYIVSAAVSSRIYANKEF